VTACSASSTDTEAQGERQKRERPKRFLAPPFLDGVEERDGTPTAAKRGRPQKLQSKAGRPRLHSVGAEHPDFDDEPEHPVQPPADAAHSTHARDVYKPSCSTTMQRREGTTRVVPNNGVVRRPFAVQPPLDPMAPTDVREGNKSSLTR
jgi:hypothetical protein